MNLLAWPCASVLADTNQDLLSFDTRNMNDGTGTEIPGFLRFVMLRMLDIKIDYSDNLVDFYFDTKRLTFDPAGS